MRGVGLTRRFSLLLTAWGSDILIKPRESPKVRYLVRSALRHARRIIG